MIGKLYCRLLRLVGRDHIWRKAHKAEVQGHKYCRLCSTAKALRTRRKHTEEV